MSIRCRLYTWRRLLMQNVLLRRRLMIILSLLPAIILIILCNNIYVDIYEYKTNYQSTIAHLESTKNKHIDDIINNRKGDMQLQNAYTIGYIQHQLQDDYAKKDLLTIERELHSTDKNTALISLYHDALSLDNNNTRTYGEDKQERLFLADKDRIIISPKNVTEDLFVPWGEVINKSTNKELEKSVITSILTEDRTGDSTDDDILFIPERNMPKSVIEYNKKLKDSDGRHLEITKPGIESINDLIDSGGVTALKAYDLIVPSYFDAGRSLTKNNTDGKISHKLILLRSSNLYEIVKPYDTYISTYNTLIKDYKEKTESAIISKIVTCVVISIFLITLFSICLYTISKTFRFESITDSRKGGNING